MQIITVGKLLEEGKTAYPEMMVYQYEPAGHVLRLFIRTPSTSEIEAVTEGPARFGLFLEGDVIFILFRFDTLTGRKCLIGEAPYSWHLVKGERTLPDLDFEPDIGAMLSVILINAENGRVAGLRVLAFAHKFSKRLHRAIHDQAGQPFDEANYDRQVRTAFNRRSSKDMWRMCEVTCKAGERD